MKNITAQLEAISGKKVESVDLSVNTFVSKSSIYSFDLTKTGKVKTGSIKYFSSVENFNNCSY